MLSQAGSPGGASILATFAAVLELSFRHRCPICPLIICSYYLETMLISRLLLAMDEIASGKGVGLPVAATVSRWINGAKGKRLQSEIVIVS